MNQVRRWVPYLAVGLVAGLVSAAGPSVARAAYDAMNADKVDGRHAVGASATISDRAGKLVATDASGRLPNNILLKALDSARLAGRTAASFAPASHDHDKRYYTKGQIDARPSARLLAVGYMSDSGVLSQAATSGNITGSRSSTGVYPLVLPGLRPGCQGGLPVFIGTPGFSGVFVTVNSTVTSCATGDVTITVAVYLPSGAFYDAGFNFAVYGPPQ
ncbi:hypothetical protein [Nocardioides marmoribigeumensis]|uniref:Uncharacterized protein n=1 Tax=Nocardioides marmoribigeumensis TaxID=433649 RepID=A0ABU2BR00_9ACTN|nr:hypothetical protein [Nocardioides marmoribigeumensis]MDR7361050.1 hypothetical protein [Nocardioides marmoribigeumensis]